MLKFYAATRQKNKFFYASYLLPFQLYSILWYSYVRLYDKVFTQRMEMEDVQRKYENVIEYLVDVEW